MTGERVRTVNDDEIRDRERASEGWRKKRGQRDEPEKRKGPRVRDKTAEVGGNFRNRQTPRKNIESHKG